MIEEGFSTKDFIVPLPSAVKNQALRDAESVFKRSLESGRIPSSRNPSANGIIRTGTWKEAC